MLETPFMDEVHKATYKGMVPHKHADDPYMQQVTREYRTALRQAQKFVVEDDIVRLVCNLSLKWKKIELWGSLSRLPYDVIWIEYDNHERVKENCRIGINGSPPKFENISRKVGFLFRKDLPSTTRWIVHEFQVEDDFVHERPLVMIFDPEGSALTPVRGSTLLKQETLSLRGFPPIHVKMKFLDPGDLPPTIDFMMTPEASTICHVDTSGDMAVIGNDGLVLSPPWVYNKVGVVLSNMWEHYIGKVEFENDEHRIKNIHDATTHSLESRRAHLRWLICLLATINEVPTHTRFVKPRTGTMQVRSHNLKYMEHNIITLNVPKRPNLVRYVERLFHDEAMRRRRHDVRGHWRCIEYGNRRPIPCQHLNTEMDEGMGICPDCERIVRWIDEHSRGDAAVGVVTHEYRVRGRNRRPPKESSVNRVESPPGHGYLGISVDSETPDAPQDHRP